MSTQDTQESVPLVQKSEMDRQVHRLKYRYGPVLTLGVLVATCGGFWINKVLTDRDLQPIRYEFEVPVEDGYNDSWVTIDWAGDREFITVNVFTASKERRRYFQNQEVFYVIVDIASMQTDMELWTLAQVEGYIEQDIPGDDEEKIRELIDKAIRLRLNIWEEPARDAEEDVTAEN